MHKVYRLLRYDWPLHFVLFLTNWLPDSVRFIRFRGALAAPFFKSCGKRLGLGRNITFYNPSQVSIGSDVYIAYGCWFSASRGLEIQDEVLFGPYVAIATSNHTKLNGSFRFGPPKGDKVTICKGSWIGAHCSIGAGVRVGTGSVIGSNSFVNKEVTNHTLFAGTPAKFIKEIPDEHQKKSALTNS